MTALHLVRDALLRPAGRLSRRGSPSESNTILIFQPDHLGDIVLSQPAVRHIRESFPGHHLVGVVGPWSESIARLVWPVDDVVTVNFPGFDRESNLRGGLSPYVQLRHDASLLGGLNAAYSCVLRPDAWWAAWLAALVTGGPVATSNDPRVIPFGSLHAHVEDVDHATQRSLSIAQMLTEAIDHAGTTFESDPLYIPEQPGYAQHARDVLHDIGINGEYIVVHPGAGAPVKQWPADRWRKVIAHLGATGTRVIVTGSTSERDIAFEVASASDNATSVAGQTSLQVLIELLREADLVLGPDSGPLHLAVACGTPSIHLFGPSDPLRYGPWGSPERHRVVTSDWSCSRCGDLSHSRHNICGCMAAIDSDEVIEVARELRWRVQHA